MILLFEANWNIPLTIFLMLFGTIIICVGIWALVEITKWKYK